MGAGRGDEVDYDVLRRARRLSDGATYERRGQYPSKERGRGGRTDELEVISRNGPRKCADRNDRQSLLDSRTRRDSDMLAQSRMLHPRSYQYEVRIEEM